MSDDASISRRSVADDLGTAGGLDMSAPGESLLERATTGVPGLDDITMGGLPAARTTLVTGTAGSGKTVLAAQFLREGILRGQGTVMVTFEEPAADMRENLRAFGWDVDGWERDGALRFVDASPVGSRDTLDRDGYDFEALLARIGHAVDHTAAERIALDSINTVFSHGSDPAMLRHQMRRLALELRRLRLTVVMTVESVTDYNSPVSRYGFEEFVADNVIILRNVLENESRRRTLEVLKMRGAMHRKGEYPLTILPGQGLVVIPLAMLDLNQQSTDTRVASGNAALDGMCGGGLFRDSVVLVSGPTGTGKSLMVTEFIAGGVDAGERAMLFSFEESREQVLRNARSWGHDLAAMEDRGLLRIVTNYPEAASLEDHLVEMTRAVESFRPQRVALDSLSALHRSGTLKGFREFLMVFSSYVKAEQIATLLTATSTTLVGGISATDVHISTLTDTIILLRYVEVQGHVKRGIAVLKMRGSRHDTAIREFTIDGDGMSVGEPFTDTKGVLSGWIGPTGER